MANRSSKVSRMKGPGYKTSLDIRRTWKCPACGVERKQLGDVTTMTCTCREGGVFMAIVTEKIVAPRPYQPLNENDVRSATFGIDDMPVLEPHPSTIPAPRTPARRSYGEPPANNAEPQPAAADAPATVRAKANVTARPAAAAPSRSTESPEPKTSHATAPTPPTTAAMPEESRRATAPESTLTPTATPGSEPDDDWGEGIL